MTKTGRPSFSIRPARLKTLREQAGLTQKALAWPVFGVETLNGKVSDPRTAANSYQRVECTGKTSKQAARKIAEVLAQSLGQDPEKTLAFLCGGAPEAPPDRVQEIEKRLRELHLAGSNPALEVALQQARQSEQPDEADISIKDLARSIAFKLETAQLEQRHEELEKLAGLTGWTVADLLRPTSLHGHWLLITKTLVQREAASRETEILLGVSDVLRQIEKNGTEWLGIRNASDACVNLIEEASWFRVTLSQPNWPVCLEFSFVRCAPSAAGLQWVQPSEWDRSKLLGDQWRASALLEWAFQHASCVKGFKADEVWPRNQDKLRLLVQRRVRPENPETAEDKDWWQTEAIHRGFLGEEPEWQQRFLDQARAEGQGHATVTNWLASGLWEDVLAPMLSPIPADWWRVETWGGGIRIHTKDVTLSEAARYGLEHEGRDYTIRLVEEAEAGGLLTAPWPQRNKQGLTERLQQDLKASQEQVAIGPQRPRWIPAP